MMRLATLLIFVLLGWSFTGIYAQQPKIPKLKTYEFTVSSSDSVMIFDVLAKHEPKIDVKNGRMYYWYKSNAIMHTNGGFDGKLLHGTYSAFFINKNLKEKGKFKNGLKTGEWKTWHDNGNIKEIALWSNGLKDGHYTVYDINGDLIELGEYKNNKHHGTVKTFFEGKIKSTQKYKNGIAMEPKIKKAFRAKAPQEEKSGSSEKVAENKSFKTKIANWKEKRKKSKDKTAAPGDKKTFKEKLKNIFKKEAGDTEKKSQPKEKKPEKKNKK